MLSRIGYLNGSLLPSNMLVYMLCSCRAPQLFAALLRKAGASAQLLPLLAEPASAAVRGLSITARRARPTASAAFLKVPPRTLSGFQGLLELKALLRKPKAPPLCSALRPKNTRHARWCLPSLVYEA